MVKTNGVKEVLVWEEKHKHYGFHSHILTKPSMRADILFRLMTNALKNLAPNRIVVEQKTDGMEVKLYSKRLRGYRTRYLRMTYISGKTKYHRIHIHFEHSQGKRYFFNALKILFPNAKIVEEILIPEHKRVRIIQKPK